MEYEQQEANHFIGREYVDIKIFNTYDTVLCCLHSLLEVSDFLDLIINSSVHFLLRLAYIVCFEEAEEKDFFTE